MSHKTCSIISAFACVWMLSICMPAEANNGFYQLPPLPPPEEYGNILIDRLSTKNGVKPVSFSHWKHRMKYTCRVCHSELEFNMKVNTTEISQLAIRKKKYCGACHNGKTAFRINGNCDTCHNGNIGYGNDKFSIFSENPFPHTTFGNGVNWVESLRRPMINPAHYLKTKSQDMPFDKTLNLEAEWSAVTPAVFSHKIHAEWLACDSCHPDTFNIKKKTTEHFSMAFILKGQFCGVCHLNTAFPINDCQRCHVGMKGTL